MGLEFLLLLRFSSFILRTVEMSNTNDIKNTPYICNTCQKVCRSQGGLKLHSKRCEQNNEEVVTSKSMLENKTPEEPKPPDPPNREPPEKLLDATAQYMKDVSEAYEKIVYWRQNILLLPSGKQGKMFIEEMNNILNDWLTNSELKPIAMKSLMIMPSLLLQKPSKTSKPKDHIHMLERRLELWKEKNIKNLLEESQSIQEYLEKSKMKVLILETSKRFVRAMEKGNVITGAIKLLSENTFNGTLPLTKKTLDMLRLKHPSDEPAAPEVLLDDVIKKVHPIRFEKK